MPRPERVLDPDESPAARFAHDLREVWRAQNVSLTVFAKKIAYGTSTVSGAFNGEKVPAWPLVRAILSGCGITNPTVVDEWRVRWDLARQGKAEIPISGKPSSQPKRPGPQDPPVRASGGSLRPPDKPTMTNVADKLNELRRDRHLTWKQLAKLSAEEPADEVHGSHTHRSFGASTLHEAIVARKRPPLLMTLRVVELCGGEPCDLIEWADSWHTAADMVARASSRPVGTSSIVPPSRPIHDVTHLVLGLADRATGSWHATMQVVLLLFVPIVAVGALGLGMYLLVQGNLIPPQVVIGALGALGGVATASLARWGSRRRRPSIPGPDYEPYNRAG